MGLHYLGLFFFVTHRDSQSLENWTDDVNWVDNKIWIA